MIRLVFFNDFECDGYVVVLGIVLELSCDEFMSEVWEWLESFFYGFKRDDRFIWIIEYLFYSIM